MLRIMLGTGVRCGELIGLTWEDVDVRTKAVSIDHQLIYKDLGDAINSIFPRQRRILESELSL